MSPASPGRVLVVLLMLMSAPMLLASHVAPAPSEPLETLDATMEDFTAVNTGLPTTGEFLYCTMGDVNGDGFDDIAAAASNYSRRSGVLGLRVYTAKGGTSWEDNSTGLPTTDRYGGIGLADVDGDDDLDLVAGIETAEGSSNRGITVWLNNGTVGGKLSWVSGPTPTTSSTYSMVTAADVDGDGDADVVAGTKSNGVRVWFGNGGAGGSLTWTERSTGLPRNGMYTGVAVADMNKDGKKDIVACDYGGGIEAHLWTGDGSGSWTSRDSSFPSGTEATMGIGVGDFDQDGNMDIVYGRRNNAVKCLLGNGGGATGTSFCWTAANTGLSTSSRYSQVSVADVDFDGDPDVLAASDGRGLELYLSNGGAGGSMAWSEADVGLPSGKFYGAALGDFNNDGVLDAVGALYANRNAGGLRAYKGKVTGLSHPTALAVWNGTGTNTTSMTLGDSITMDGRGSYDAEDAPDGDPTGQNLTYEWNLTATPAGSALTDADLSPSESSATPTLTPDAVGHYALTLAVRDSDGRWSLSQALLEMEALKPNDPPTADAGPDQTVITGQDVLLNGSGSYDVDGTLVGWEWNASPGNPGPVALEGWNTSTPRFVAPNATGVYALQLRVRDDNGTWSVPDQVNVTVELPPNVPPVAVAGEGSVTTLGREVELNGSGSYDVDGALVEWAWNCTSHPGLVIEDRDAPVARTTPGDAGRYNFTLTVRDDRGDWSEEASVSVVVLAPEVNSPPVAAIYGPSTIQVIVGEMVTVDGSGSYDEDGRIAEYVWNATTFPGLELDGQNTSVVTFTPDVTGRYVVTLAVRDDNGTWSLAEDSVEVIAHPVPPPNLPPVAAIWGAESSTNTAAVIPLHGEDSYDDDGVVVAYRWACTSHPDLDLTGQNTAMVMFSPGGEGTFRFTLEVQDDGGAWSLPAEHTVVVRVPNLPPSIRVTAPADGTIEVGNTTLKIEWEASDPNGDELEFLVEVLANGLLEWSRGGIPGDARNLTLRWELDGLPRGVGLHINVTALEVDTDEALSATDTSGTITLLDPPPGPVDPEPVEGPEESEVLSFHNLWVLLLVLAIVIPLAVVILLLKDRDEGPQRRQAAASTGPTMTACPACGGTVDSDNAFDLAYCPDCDRYW